MNRALKKQKTFDCVASKRKAQERIYRRIRGLSHAEELAYFKQAVESGPLAEFWRKASKAGRDAADTSTGR